MLCGVEGNPLTVAATKSVEVFNETLRILQVNTSQLPPRGVVKKKPSSIGLAPQSVILCRVTPAVDVPMNEVRP